MNINDDNTILRKIEKNSINYYGSDATNLIKENSLLRKLIDFYQNHIEISKNKIINYFQTDNKFLKEILMYDINQFNKELQDFNIKIKNENLKLQNKINEFNKNIISNIQKINEENDKLKEDNFILLNENKSRDSIIKILTKEKIDKELSIFNIIQKKNSNENKINEFNKNLLELKKIFNENKFVDNEKLKLKNYLILKIIKILKIF
jgi:hypothetical protein